MTNFYHSQPKTEIKKLTNFKIIDRQDIKNQDYYIIFDNNNEGGNNAYFCWSDDLKKGVKEIISKDIKEIEIEWEPKDKGNKVVRLYFDSEDNFLI